MRQAAYRIGLEQLGAEFARAALEDSARSVRTWATKALTLRPERIMGKGGPHDDEENEEIR